MALFGNFWKMYLSGLDKQVSENSETTKTKWSSMAILTYSKKCNLIFFHELPQHVIHTTYILIILGPIKRIKRLQVHIVEMCFWLSNVLQTYRKCQTGSARPEVLDRKLLQVSLKNQTRKTVYREFLLRFFWALTLSYFPYYCHSIYTKTVISQHIFFALLNLFKLVYGPLHNDYTVHQERIKCK